MTRASIGRSGESGKDRRPRVVSLPRRCRRRRLVRARGHFIHPVAEIRINFRRLHLHQRQDLMARSHLGQMNVGFETDFLEIGDPLAGQRVVEVFGNRIRIEAHAAAGNLRRR